MVFLYNALVWDFLLLSVYTGVTQASWDSSSYSVHGKAKWASGEWVVLYLTVGRGGCHVVDTSFIYLLGSGCSCFNQSPVIFTITSLACLINRIYYES